MKLRIVALATTLLIAPAAAHEAAKGPNGGRVVEGGTHHVELVVRENVVSVFVMDANDKPISVTGFKGVVIFTISSKAQRIVLDSKDGTRLFGTSPLTLPADPAGVIQLTAPNGTTIQGRFR